jgi:hypothetical protein
MCVEGWAHKAISVQVGDSATGEEDGLQSMSPPIRYLDLIPHFVTPSTALLCTLLYEYLLERFRVLVLLVGILVQRIEH